MTAIDAITADRKAAAVGILPPDPKVARRLAIEAELAENERLREEERQIEATRNGDKTTWISMFANMMVSGSPIEQCAIRLGRPRAKLEAMMETDFFKTMLEQVAAESKSNVGLALLQGSTVDNIYCLMRLRDSQQTKPELRAKIAMYLLDRTEGVKRDGFGGQLGRSLLDNLGNGSIDDAATKEIERLMAAHPELVAQYRGRRLPETNADAPELAQGQPVGASQLLG